MFDLHSKCCSIKALHLAGKGFPSKHQTFSCVNLALKAVLLDMVWFDGHFKSRGGGCRYPNTATACTGPFSHLYVYRIEELLFYLLVLKCNFLLFFSIVFTVSKRVVLPQQFFKCAGGIRQTLMQTVASHLQNIMNNMLNTGGDGEYMCFSNPLDVSLSLTIQIEMKQSHISWLLLGWTLYPVMVLTCRRGIFHRTLKAVQLTVSSWMSSGGLRRSGLYKDTQRWSVRAKDDIKTEDEVNVSLWQVTARSSLFLAGKQVQNQTRLMLYLHGSLGPIFTEWSNQSFIFISAYRFNTNSTG